MITNLVASVVVGLVTNTSERLPTHYVSDPCPSGIIGCAVFHAHSEPDADPQVKWIRTTIKEVTSLVYTNGLTSQVVSEVVKSDLEVELKKQVQVTWVPSSTNEVPAVVAVTNGIASLTNWDYFKFSDSQRLPYSTNTFK